MKISRKKIKKLISNLLILTIAIGFYDIVSTEVINEDMNILAEKEDKTEDDLISTEENQYEVKNLSEEKSEKLQSENEDDKDNDGVSDGLEELFGADSTKEDTDEDGLSDLLEIKLSLNPSKVDTDDNGVFDLNEDTDNDDLTNGEEIKIGTDCSKKDTDADGLSDGEEAKIYKTSPLIIDTDGDGIYDGDEIKLKLNPNKVSSDGIIEDSKRKIEQVLSKNRISQVSLEESCLFKPSLYGKVSNLLDRKIYINSFDITPIENIKGILGEAVNIISEYGQEENFTLSFDYTNFLKEHDKSVLNNLAICYYTEGSYTILNTVNDEKNNCLCTEINKGGVYFILDKIENMGILYEETVTTTKYLASNSTVDSDYDGIPDSTDSAPKSNNFSGELKTSFATSKVSYTMDYRNFFASKKQYNSNISTISSLFSADIYSGTSYNGMNLTKFMTQHGIKNIKDYNLASMYSDSDVSEAYIGHKKVTYNGVTKEIIVIVVRGTNGTIKEWESNFDIGSTANKSKYTDWKVSANHKGFDIAATRILKCLEEYESKSYLDKSAQKTYWITGHSRGAGIANILGARLVKSSKDVYCYTFAAPNTTTTSNAENTTTYPGIYNILNKDDFVPCLPVTQWGFKHYGKSYTVSVASNYEKEWESLTGISDYNPDTLGMEDSLNNISKIISNRNDAYKYTCKCHGDGSLNNITIRNYGTSESSREKAIAKIPSNALPYCKITRYKGGAFSGWDFTVCQQPEYFMQLLVAFMANKINAYRFGVELNIADRYESAKLSIVRSGLGGLEHPHYNESYYLLSKHI